MAKALFINSKELKRFTNLNGNVDSDRYLDAVYEAQTRHIKQLLGTDLFDRIAGHITAGNLDSNATYKALLDDYIKPVLINYAMVELLPRLHFQLTNKGIYIHNSENSTSATTEDVNIMVERYSSIAQYYGERLTDHLSFYSSNFPEYLSNTNDEIHPDRRGYFTGLVLD